MDIGKNFKIAREKRGMKQKDAADALEVSASFLSKVESNKKTPNLDLILKAASVYGVDRAYFLDGQDEIDIEKDIFNEKNKEFVQSLESMTLDEIVKKYNIKLDEKVLSEDEVKALIAFVRSMRSMG